MTALAVGKPYIAGRASWPEGAEYNYRAGQPDESARELVRQKKHSRGDAARIERGARREREGV